MTEHHILLSFIRWSSEWGSRFDRSFMNPVGRIPTQCCRPHCCIHHRPERDDTSLSCNDHWTMFVDNDLSSLPPWTARTASTARRSPRRNNARYSSSRGLIILKFSVGWTAERIPRWFNTLMVGALHLRVVVCYRAYPYCIMQTFIRMAWPQQLVLKCTLIVRWQLL